MLVGTGTEDLSGSAGTIFGLLMVFVFIVIVFGRKK